MNKKICSLILIINFIILLAFSNAVYASGTEDPQNGTSMNNTEEEKSSLFSLFSRSQRDPYTGKNYTHNSRFDGKEIKYAIDVSKYNGSINWNKVKADGIEYAMIRVGYRSFGSNSQLYEDPNFRQNIEGAINAGLKVGVYFYSQAITRAEANEEADFVVSRIKKYNITLPVAIDYEYASDGSGLTGRLYNAKLSKKDATNVCKGFGSSVKAEGYVPMVYANKSMLQNQLNADELSSRYTIWLSNYTTETSYTGEYSVWQYTSKGSVDGISGNVDCNFWYEDAEDLYNGVDYSAVYNYDYYVNHNPDIKQAYGNNPKAALAHFVSNGMNEGRRASEEFDVYAYMNRYADLKNAYGNNLKEYYIHYIYSGKKEGRNARAVGSLTVYNGVDYSSVYQYTYYINKYGDLKAAFGNDEAKALEHFVNCGMTEGRQGSEEFNVYTYKNRYVDLRTAFGNNLREYYIHYINNGKKEGRSGAGTSDVVGSITIYNGKDYSAVYDYDFYLKNNLDIKAVYGADDIAALEHFVNTGMDEGRYASEEFDVTVYRNRYKDLRNAFGNDLRQYYIHYINNGKSEGRSGESILRNPITRYKGKDYSSIYDFKYYIEHNADIKQAYGDDDMAVLEHFVNTGMNEGRWASEEFNVNTYKNRYSDLRRAFGNNLREYYIHYINNGKKEGRSGSGTSEVEDAVTNYGGIDYSSVYDYQYYVDHNPDIKEAYGEDDAAVLDHFVNCGMSEGRQGNADFDVDYYRKEYDDLRKAFGDDLKKYYMHYISNGINEGRNGVDPDADSYTIYKGVDYADVYDYEYYRDHNDDIKETCGDDKRATLIHFVKYGMKEGQIASETFDVHYYKESNPDLQEKYGDDWELYYLHYINIGKKDGRKGVADSSSDSGKKDTIVEKENVVLDDSEVKDAEMDSLTDNNLEGETDEKIEESEDENPIDENADKEVDNEENGF